MPFSHNNNFGVRIAFFALSLGLAWAANAEQPSPELQPAEVVTIQLEALRHNDDPVADAGIAQVWVFTSPSNKRLTGPLDNFIEMVHASYSDMLNHRDAEFLAEISWQGMFLQRVVLTTRDGRQVGYVFSLSQQDSDSCMGCWMTDGVVLDPVQPRAQRVI